MMMRLSMSMSACMPVLSKRHQMNVAVSNASQRNQRLRKKTHCFYWPTQHHCFQTILMP